MRVLITGATGLLGPYLLDAFSECGVIPTGRLDLTHRVAVQSVLANKPDVVIHAAAMTSIDECERDPISALAINRDITANLAELMDPKSKLVYISTDMVYPDIQGPHREGDVGPVNMYGRSKLAGEKAAQANPRHLIVRTNFFGPSRTPGRKSLSDWVIESLKGGLAPIFYHDVWFSPLHAQTLCTLIYGLVKRDVVGIYNLGSRTGLSKAQFAMLVAEQSGLYDKYRLATVGPAHWRTKRPHDTTLDSTKLCMSTREPLTLPTLEEEIAKL